MKALEESVTIHHEAISSASMREGHAIGFLLCALLLVGGTSAMSSSGQQARGRCEVIDGHKLLPASGAAEAICTQIEHAIASRAPAAHYDIRVRVLSPSRLSATVAVDGRTLPVQNFAVMDNVLNSASIDHFAAALAAAVDAADGGAPGGSH